MKSDPSESTLSQPLAGKTIVLGVTGSIAAYKAADLTSLLVQAGALVYPVLTRAACEFIQPLTLQVLARKPAASDLWAEKEGWQPGHIDLADRADLLLVAPATAHVIAQFAHGLAPDLLTCIYLATRAPVLVCPAMNGKMYAHPATVANLDILRGRNVAFVDPVPGMLACGYEGNGKLAPVDEIYQRVVAVLTATGPAGVRTN